MSGTYSTAQAQRRTRSHVALGRYRKVSSCADFKVPEFKGNTILVYPPPPISPQLQTGKLVVLVILLI